MSSAGQALLWRISRGPEPCMVLYPSRAQVVVPAEAPEPTRLGSDLSCVASYSHFSHPSYESYKPHS